MPQPLDIAIIGLAGCYAGAGNVRRYWQNILDKVDATTEADDEWTGPYLDPEHYASRNDRIYTRRGGFLHDLARIDPAQYGVMPNQADGGDPDHLLALKHAADALVDAGYRERPFDRERAGVVLGRGTYANRGQASVLFHGLFVDQMLDMVRDLRADLSADDLARLRAQLKQQLPPYGVDTVAQITPNVVAGMIANRLDLMGPNYLVDAACASTLLAVEQAARELASGRCDLMIAGGVQAHTPAQLYIQFSQIGALSRDRVRPFQRGAGGTLLGEGVGMLVLKRLADAERDGDRIYAVIKGIGIASDGRAKGLLTPRPQGQILALRRAYESSSIDPDSVDLIEAHGTGTEVGDRTEIDTLKAIFGGRGPGPQIALGSVKSMIGHCLPASGSASLIKTALALHHRVLPPTLCDEPDPALELERTPLYVNDRTRPWVHGKPHGRRAAVNAFGFGGINAHVVLEEYLPGSGARRTQVQVLHRPAPTELFLLSAPSRVQLAECAGRVLARLATAAAPELSALAKASSRAPRAAHRLAIVAQDTAQLRVKLEQALDKLQRPQAAPFKTRSGIHYGCGSAPGKLCFLYPGEGSQYADMLADLCLHFPQLRAWFDFIERQAVQRGAASRAQALFPAPTGHTAAQLAALEARRYEMDVAAESVFAASMGMQALFDSLGLQADAMLGHSTGENTALIASGLRRLRSTEEIADSMEALHSAFRGLDAQGRIARGSLLSVGALAPALRARLLQAAGAQAFEVAMDNCPNQLVLFGMPERIRALREELTAEGAICQELPFGRAYHTPWFQPLADVYRAHYRGVEFAPARVQLYSACSAAPFPQDPEAIRELAAVQWQSRVRFTETIERLYADGCRIFVEVGPSGSLTSFVGDILRTRPDVVALASNSRRQSGVQQLHGLLAQLFACGIAFDPAALYAQREIGEIDLFTAPAPAQSREIALRLQMPRLQLPAEWKAATPAAGAAAAAPPTVAARTGIVDAGQVPSSANESAAVTPASRRIAALHAHFSLMQAFLDSQARVLGLAQGGEPAAGLDENYPLLGPVLEQGRDHLVSERLYSASTDRFLHDHAIGAAPSARNPALLPLAVVPFTFSMEIVAEAACRLAGGELKVIRIENARAYRWLSLDEDGCLRLRIVASRLPADGDGELRVAVKLQHPDAEDGAAAASVFEGQVVLAARYPPPPRPLAAPEGLLPARRNPPGELYRHGMFHGPRLQGVEHLRGWSEAGIEADMVTIATQDYFSFTRSPRFRLDPALLDATGQLAGFWLSEKIDWGANCFPFQLGVYAQYADPLPAGTRLLCRAALRLTDPMRVCGDFDLVDARDRLLARATHWEDRRFAAEPRLYGYRIAPQRGLLTEPCDRGDDAHGRSARRLTAFAEGYLDQGGGLWMHMLAHLVLTHAERRSFYRALPGGTGVRERWLMTRIAAKEAVRDWAASRFGLELASADIEILDPPHGGPAVGAIAGWPAGLALPLLWLEQHGRDVVAACTQPSPRQPHAFLPPRLPGTRNTVA